MSGKQITELHGDVMEFHATMGQANPPMPVDDPSPELRQSRAHIEGEEYMERMIALVGLAAAMDIVRAKALEIAAKRGFMGPGDMVELADAASDVRVVATGGDASFGVNGYMIDRLVMESNMKKVGGGKDPTTGKFLKPPGWQPPAIEAELRAQGWKGQRKAGTR